MYSHFLSILGPFQQEQNRFQLSPEEMSHALKQAKSSKEMIQFYKMLSTSMEFSYPENIMVEDLSKTEIFKDKENFFEYKKKNTNVFINKLYFLFLLKYNIIINCYDYTLWDFENMHFLSKENVDTFLEWTFQYMKCKLFVNNDCLNGDCICKKQNKKYFVQCLQNEIDEIFQICLEYCKFETQQINVEHDMKQKLIDNLEKYVYFTSILYFQDYIQCLQKLKNLNKTCHRIYENEKDELDCIEYNMDLLQIFHKKTLNIENILSLGILENIKPEICIYYLTKI